MFRADEIASSEHVTSSSEIVIDLIPLEHYLELEPNR